MDVKAVHPGLDGRATLESVHSVGPGDRIRSGFETVVAVARRVPLIWPLGLLGGLPGVSAVGQALYDAVSRRRQRDPAWDKRPKGPDPQRGTPRPPDRPEKPRARR
jgi:hypothetical protein